MTVTVYSKPACVQCTATKRDLENRGIEFNEIDITQDDAAREMVLGLGYLAAPVVVTDTDNWGNYRSDKIAALAELVAVA